MQRKTLRKYEVGSIMYVLEHAKWAASRGRNPSMAFGEIRDPNKALEMAKKMAPVSKHFRSTACNYVTQLVGQSFKILPFGVVVTGHTPFWSEDFLPFGDSSFICEVCNAGFKIRRKRNRKVVKIISPKHVFVCEVLLGQVHPNGYIESIGNEDGPYENRYGSWDDADIADLSRAWLGVMPCNFDGSAFERVSPKLAGQHVYMICDSTLNTVWVYDLAGNKIEHITHHPLAYETWGVPRPQSFDLSPDDWLGWEDPAEDASMYDDPRVMFGLN